jgi:diacylglycerol O-acyltransferase-1
MQYRGRIVALCRPTVLPRLVELQEHGRVLEAVEPARAPLDHKYSVQIQIKGHLYFPMLKHSVKRWQANLVVFLVSALAHEFVISASLGIIEFWAFFGMMTQAPVILCQEKIEKVTLSFRILQTLKLQNSQLGNVMFWISFCFLGQPLLIFVYYYHFLQKQKAFA